MTSQNPRRAAPVLELVSEGGRPVRPVSGASARGDGARGMAAAIRATGPDPWPADAPPAPGKRPRSKPHLRPVPPPGEVPLLVIGPDEMCDQLHRLPPGPRLRVAPSEVTQGLLRRLSPGAIAIPLFIFTNAIIALLLVRTFILLMQGKLLVRADKATLMQAEEKE